MRVVLDTNVLVSGLITPQGTCGRIVRLALAGPLRLCADRRILDEYEAVLPRPLFGLRPDDVADVLGVIRTAAEMVTPLPLAADLPDEADLPFLEVAAAAGAVLVTGNTRHFPRKVCRNVPVVRPAEFLELLRHSSSE